MRARSDWTIALTLVFFAACGDSEAPDDGGLDAAAPVDSAVMDTGPRDSGPVDSGVLDTGGLDTGLVDSGEVDAGFPDAAEPDTGLIDSGLMDAGFGDAGCVPSGAEVCDGEDNDCDGFIDNIDVGGDGLYDCARIALLGGAGSLGSSNFLAWLQGNGVTVDRIQTDSSSLTPALLANYDVIVLDRLVRSYSQAEADDLQTWVENGGGVMSMTGYSGAAADIDRPNSLLRTLGLEYVPGLRNGPVTMFLPHSTTSSLTSITFAGGFRVGVLPGPMASTSTVVARLSDGPAAVAAERDQGRVFVWGDEWVQFDSEWMNLPEIPIFWANVLGWLEHLR